MPRNRGSMTEAMYYVLLALCKPLHGYAIMNSVRDLSRGRVRMGPGTLYGVLTRLEKEKLIQLEEVDGRRKVYSITPAGLDALREEHRRLAAMVADGNFLGEGD
ncbi:MAG TPA: helix-turn-helix transcriptional regulator [Bacillota bacterium]|nr:helix-turn-helix transcriptional regulator [Bacillota bacterium]